VRKEVLHGVKEERNILRKIKRWKANWMGHILRRNCFLKHIIEGKVEERIKMTGRRERRRKQLLNDLKEMRGYWKLNEDALDRTLR
jgi:ribosomal protein L35